MDEAPETSSSTTTSDTSLSPERRREKFSPVHGSARALETERSRSVRDHGQSPDISEVGVVRDDGLLAEQSVGSDDGVGTVEFLAFVASRIVAVGENRVVFGTE